MNRREFIVGAGAGASALAFGSNNQIRVAVAGLRSRGRQHILEFAKNRDSIITALCDPDDEQVRRGLELTRSLQTKEPKVYKDIRRLLEDKDIDVLAIATSNHWHALGTIWACQAGKDVFCEKPASHNIWEGRKMVDAARKYKRIVQVCMQSRSNLHKQKAVKLLRNGVIGELYMAKGLCYKRRLSIGSEPEGSVPNGVEYDLWLGPAPMRPFRSNRFHYNWHWFWDTGNGDIGNQGVHEMDVARWGLGKSGLPNKVYSSGGHFAYDDDQETPNTQIATFDYDDCQLVFEVRGLLTKGEADIEFDGRSYIGNIFFGSEGVMVLDPSGYRVYLGEERALTEELGYQEEQIWDSQPIVANFLEAVKSRDAEHLSCDVEEGHLSAALCHMANISYRTGRSLTFDPSTESFPGDDEANQLLSREYREPFVVPDEV